MSQVLMNLERLLTLYIAMADAAEAQDWELLTGKDAERLLLADSLPDDLHVHVLPSEQNRAKMLIENCISCEAKIRPEIEGRLRELRVLLREPKPVS